MKPNEDLQTLYADLDHAKARLDQVPDEDRQVVYRRIREIERDILRKTEGNGTDSAKM